MIIAFDGTILNAPKTGIGYYTQFLIHHLAAEQPDLALTTFDGRRMRAYEPATSEVAAAHSRPPLLSPLVSRLRQVNVVRKAWRTFKAASFSHAMRDADIFHATNYLPPAKTGVPTLPLIHDLSHIRHPQWHPAERRRWLESRADEFLAAPIINTVSHFSASEIETVLGIAPERIRVTYPGINPVYNTEPGDERSVLHSFKVKPGGFFLCAGTLEPRKNLMTAIHAFSKLPASFQERFPLLIAGPPGWGNLALPPATQQLESQGLLRFLGYIDEASMRGLYQECAAFLFPSSYEGFGMPVSEAMARGTRPVISGGSSPEEVAGDLGIVLPAFDVEAWQLVMERAIEENWHADSKLRTRLRERSRLFNWSANAKATRAIYDALLQ